MASTLTGAVRALSWSDFTRKTANPPGPDDWQEAADTQTAIGLSGISFKYVSKSNPAEYQMADTVTVSVVFRAAQSYVLSWLFKESQKTQDDLLHHEQGHYDLTGLNARDFFIDLTLLQQQTFSSVQDAQDAFNSLKDETLNLNQKIQKAYDDAIHPEQQAGDTRGPIQRKWDTFIRAALANPRASGTKALDGTPHKSRLIDVLTANGVSV